MTQVADAYGTEDGAVIARDDALSEILQATVSSFTAARVVMETAARTAFTFSLMPRIPTVLH